MGNSINTQEIKNPQLTRTHFKFEKVIGRGSFGQVWKGLHIKTKTPYAIKEMRKIRILKKNSLQSVKNERELLSTLNSPFIVNCKYTFEDSINVYLVVDLLEGGDLRYHLIHHKRFTEHQSQFFIACLILALESLHSNGVVHRDVKPENLVLGSNGYLRLTDLGLSRKVSEIRKVDSSGTPGYIAPEALTKDHYGFHSDFFAVGVILYELIMRKRPYPGKDNAQVKDFVLCKQVQLRKSQIRGKWTPECIDFVNKLLQRNPKNRLGYNGAKELRSHAWFRDFSWEKLALQVLQAPFVPPKNDNFDLGHVREFKDNIDTKENVSFGFFDN